ncbi:hypothetical protein MLD38_034680 [Melastoma candidum]|uniref:Uncharacterized protein n=1 Tax=Melastoma candidum TaxID=119954 RepID=A0ACB9MAT6_9MYRT|nr:hypothetical protein MLD38_034680 [Melastoma candidum]
MILLPSPSLPNAPLLRRLRLRNGSECFWPYRTILAFAAAKSGVEDGRERFKVEYTPWLVVGLGNPGNKFHGTRHNVGFEMADRIARAEGMSLNTIQSKALVGIGCIGEVPIVLAKPQVYMNFVGESVSIGESVVGLVYSF